MPACVAIMLIVGEWDNGLAVMAEPVLSIAFARPKSRTFTVPSVVSLMFVGFKSR